MLTASGRNRIHHNPKPNSRSTSFVLRVPLLYSNSGQPGSQTPRDNDNLSKSNPTRGPGHRWTLTSDHQRMCTQTGGDRAQLWKCTYSTCRLTVFVAWIEIAVVASVSWLSWAGLFYSYSIVQDRFACNFSPPASKYESIAYQRIWCHIHFLKKMASQVHWNASKKLTLYNQASLKCFIQLSTISFHSTTEIRLHSGYFLVTGIKILEIAWRLCFLV